MTPSIIQVEKLTKVYSIGENKFRFFSKKPHSTKPFYALKDVSFEVKEGEIIGIIGRNGAGKSTLLKILSRITEPTGGVAELRGRVSSLLEVGTGFHPELTGRENVYLNGAILGMRKTEIRQKFDQIVSFAEIEKFIDTPVKRYSSGMYVRLAFAVAAHLEPEILLVDEVLAVGDQQFQQKCIGKMNSVARGGRTILFVSHNMTAVDALCQRAMLFEAGCLTASGDTKHVVDKYLTGMIMESQRKLSGGTAKNIRSVTVKNLAGSATYRFFTGEDILFEIELYHETLLERPRVSIGLHSPSGERLVTIHTDIQQNASWPFQGKKIIRAHWKTNRLVPCVYRVDVAFWGYSEEIEYLPGCRHLEILPRDIYGTGALPDPNGQGHWLADAQWEMGE